MLRFVLLLAGAIVAIIVVMALALALVARVRNRLARAQDDSPPPRREPRPSPPPPTKSHKEPPPPPDATRVVDLPAAPIAGGTQMVEWYGMLVCTAGPLEGKKFIIEEEGFWIGRDPAMSQVVVEDSRVSKRHVRIVPRDGQVRAIDHDSKNGTFLDKPGNRITEVTLTRGNTIILGDNAAAFRFQI